MIKVQKRMCKTCIYLPTSSLNIQKLESDIADTYMEGFFTGYRICHHSKDACCRGFWDRHHDHFTLGQIATRLGLVTIVDVDTLSKY